MIRLPVKPASEWLSQTWGNLKLDPEQALPKAWSEGSGLRLTFVCTCGRRVVSPFYSIKHSNSCGKCSFKSKEYWLQQTWGKLKLDPSQNLPDEWGPSSGQKFQFLCACGKPSMACVFYKIPNSCGKCSFKPKDHWLQQRWGALSLDPNQETPDEWGSSSNRRMVFLCECGQSTKTAFQNVINHSKSCGKCTEKPKEFWLAQHWEYLKLDPNQPLPLQWSAGSPIKLRFTCTCGRQVEPLFANVTAGKSQSCNKCDFQSKEHWLAQKWGELTLIPNQPLPEEWARWTEDKYEFVCTCGRTIKKEFGHIYSGNFQSCGMCDWKPASYWLSQKWGKLKIEPNQVFPQKEWGAGLASKLKFLCDCGKTKKSAFNPVLRGYTQSCGCLRPGVSDLSPAHKVYEFIKPIAPDAEFSYWFNKDNGNRTEYDIYIPSKKLAIEYHGLIWHSEKFCADKGKDAQKLLLAQRRGDRLIQIYSDEWENKQEVMKAQLREILAPENKIRIKPSYAIEYSTSEKARDFLNRNHYLGAASGCITVVAKYLDDIVGVWVFMKREEDVVLWHRACIDHDFKMWNPHEKALNLALPELRSMGFKRIVTFSDNRFHTGGLYEKLGFTLEKELKPDYGYTNGVRRVSKAALRVKAGQEETQLAKRDGWYRIWDSGKRRFSLSL